MEKLAKEFGVGYVEWVVLVDGDALVIFSGN